MTSGCDFAGVITANGLKRDGYSARPKKADTDGIVLFLRDCGWANETMIDPGNGVKEEHLQD